MAEEWTSGQIHGLFQKLAADGTGTDEGDARLLVVGESPDRAAIGSEALRAFNRARLAVAQLLEGAGGDACMIQPYGPPLGAMHPTDIRLGAPEDRIDGASVGLAYALAILSKVLDIPLGHQLYATGRIEGSGDVQTNKSAAATQAKLNYVRDSLSTGDSASLLVFMPEADIPPDIRDPKGGQAAPAWLRFPGTLAQAAREALGDNVEHRLKEAAERVQTQQREAMGAFGRGICDDADLAGGVHACARDPLLFFGLSLYFAFAAASHQRGQAPALWPMLSDSVTYGGKTLTFNDFAGRFADCWDDAGAVRNAVIEKLQHPELLPAAPAGGPDVTQLLAFINGQLDRRTAEDALAALSGEIRRETDLGTQATFAAIQRAIAKFDPDLAAGPLMEVFHQYGAFALLRNEDLTSEQDIIAGKALINSTLGGAWLVAYGLAYLRKHDPSSGKSRWPDSYAQAFNFKTLPDPEPFIDGLRMSIERQGVYAFFLEHPFHPRVLWEVIAGTNRRYPAEKIILRHFFRALGAGPEALAGENLHLFWNHDPLPLVASISADPETVSSSGNAFAVHRRVEAPRLGVIFIQDYAAFGRTNMNSNRFLQVPDWSTLAHAALPSAVHTALGPLAEEFFWLPPREPSSTPEAQLATLNARSSTVRAAAFLRQQIALNQLLAHEPEEIDALPLEELLRFPWLSVPPCEDPTLEAYLGGRGGDLAGPTGLDAFVPLFRDPLTWLGLGLATLLAFEATIGVAMLVSLDSMGGAADAEQEQRELSM